VASLATGVFVTFDPGPLVADIPRDRLMAVLERANVVSLNERERSLVGDIDVELVVLRQGPQGATILPRGEQPLHVDAERLEHVVDTSGAGDVHMGAMLAGLAQGLAWPEAIRLANEAAAFAIVRRGPAAGPTMAELEEFRLR
jgi:sugar/nucleoside kinase (ribokinase family)